jgi:hypothetical protein
MWDVFFDRKSGTKTQQNSPIVLDLNRNGKPDITGSNILGDGKIQGGIKGFDLNLKDRQWLNKSLNNRPSLESSGRPINSISDIKGREDLTRYLNNRNSLPRDGIATVYGPDGKAISTVSLGSLDEKKLSSSTMGFDLKKDQRVEFRRADGELISELKWDDKASGASSSNSWVYFQGNNNENEWTKAWDSSTGGDGLLVWDTDGDGKITSGKELFGHVALDGSNQFANGYEKLAHYFDSNRDGVVQGAELQGLKIWEDRDGDGKTDDGELVSLASRNITSLNTAHNSADMSSSFGIGQKQPAATTSAAQVAVVSGFFAHSQSSWGMTQDPRGARDRGIDGGGNASRWPFNRGVSSNGGNVDLNAFNRMFSQMQTQISFFLTRLFGRSS